MSVWPQVRFGELLSEPVRNGIYKPKEFHGRGWQIVNMGELFAHPRLRAVPMKRVELSPDEQSRFRVSPGDLLFARRSLVASGAGKCCLVCEVDAANGTTFESSIIRARPSQDLADSAYLYYFFCSHLGKNALSTILRQVAVSGITGADLANLAIPLAPLNEQRSIARLLGGLDDKIEVNRRTNQTLEGMARALFKSWFVDFDPVHAKKEGRKPHGMDAATAALFPASFEDSTIGRIPKGWKSEPLGALVTALSGGTPSKDDPSLWNGAIPWISPKIMRSIHVYESDAKVSTTALGNGTRLTPAGSTLVMVRGMGLHEEVRVSQARRDVAFNQDVKALVPVRIRPTLLLLALLDGQTELLTRVESSGHGTGRLPSDLLLAHPISLPSSAAQDALERPFESVNHKIAVLRLQTDSLTALRDALLSKLLSGELRVPEAERIAGKAV